MPPINVEKNITKIKDSIEGMKNHIKMCEDDIVQKKEEILRLEGCLIAYKGFKDANIEEIPLPDENQPRPSPKIENCLHEHENHEDSHGQPKSIEFDGFRHIR